MSTIHGEHKNKSVMPGPELRRLAELSNTDVFSKEFADLMDSTDPLRGFREKFAYPLAQGLPHSHGALEGQCVYLCGNSLGLKPRRADEYMKAQLDKWATMAVEMHFEDPLPAASCDRYGRESLGRLLGTTPTSVTLMNGLTVNLHLLLLAFYRPTTQRYKILIEGHAFPSDRYAVQSQLLLRDQPEDAIIQLMAREGEDIIRHEDILMVLEREGPSIAVVCLSGVQYYTGQKFDMAAVTSAARAQGCVVGWDLAHAIGNVEIRLDEWGVDFACWCTYKYMNSGPGCIAGAYVNKRHEQALARSDQLALRGWWSNREETRFLMMEECDAAPGVDGLRLCNPPPFLVALVMASLEIFDEAGMPRLLEKQRLLTGYLELLIQEYFTNDEAVHLDQSTPSAKIITPSNPEERGCQLSLSFSLPLKRVHQELTRRGVVCDVRQPNVMRLAPVPLYNSYGDVHNFITILREVFASLAKESPLRTG